MSSSVTSAGSSHDAASHQAGISEVRQTRALWRADVLIYLGLLCLGVLAWWIVEQGWYTPWSRTGYWLGVAGGVSMLLLFSYPIRKRWRVAQAWGASKYWFVIHMILGVMGPWMILLHSTFHIGSTNAAVALFSMLVVAFSGVVGRFLYVRLHSGLRGERSSLGQLRATLDEQHDAADSRLQRVPVALQALRSLEIQAFGESPQAKGKGHFWCLFVLPFVRHSVVKRSLAEVKKAVKRVAKDERWPQDKALAFYRVHRDQIERYAATIQKVAQFRSFEQLFSLWHVAHVPFVWIMVLCAIFHVVAVHAY